MQAVVYNNITMVCPRTTLYSEAKLTLKRNHQKQKSMGIFLLHKKTQKQIVFLQQKFADFTRDEKKFNRTPWLAFFFHTNKISDFLNLWKK